MYLVSVVPFAFVYFVAERITNAHAEVVVAFGCESASFGGVEVV